MLTHHNVTPVPPARVVILGANGFLARALAQRLQVSGTAVRCVPSREVDLTAGTAGAALATLQQADDAVVMTSALTPDKGRDTATLMKNLQMAVQVAQALAIRPCAHFLYLSSDAVYDWRHALVSEDLPPSPTDLYSLMHLAREQILREAAAAVSVPFAVLRPCAVYGPGDTHNSYGPNRFFQTARAEGRIQIFGAGEEMRDHVHVDDVTALLELCLRHRSVGVLNAVSGRSVSFAELAGMVARLCGRPVAIESLPRRGPVTHRHFDPTAMLRSFPGHRPTPIAEGLERTARAPAADGSRMGVPLS